MLEGPALWRRRIPGVSAGGVLAGGAHAEIAREEDTGRYQVTRALALVPVAPAGLARRLSLDEAHHRRGRELSTVVSDLDRRRVVEVLLGRSRVMVARYLEERTGAFSERIEAKLAPFARDMDRWMSIPGVGQRTAAVLVAEPGVGLPDTFPAGRRRPSGTTHGNKWVRGALYEAAMAATRRPDTDLGRRYRRLHARRGHRRAIVGVSHAILATGWQLERDGALYLEPHPDQVSERERARQRRRALSQLAALGYQVELREAAA